MSAPAPAKVATTELAEPRKLDDVLLAMDVVDTLRHREEIARHEFDAEAREEQLIARLKEIYSAQGIDAPERIIREGVQALEEQRFVYKPPRRGLSATLARLYVGRERWLPGLGWLGALVLAAGLIAQFAWIGPRDADWRGMPAEIAQLSQEAQALAVDPNVDRRAATLESDARRALDQGDRTAAERSLAVLQGLRDQLAADYDVRIVSRPGADTGFVRAPDTAPGARHFYLVVQAVTDGGETLRLPIRNEETQKTERVDVWAQRVSEATFDRVARDKADDQLVQDDLLGVKRRGEMDVSFREPVPGGAITQW